MTQLVELLLPILAVRSSTPVIGKIYIEHFLTVKCNEKIKIKKKEAGNGPFKKFKYGSCEVKNFEGTCQRNIPVSPTVDVIKLFGGNLDFPEIKK